MARSIFAWEIINYFSCSERSGRHVRLLLIKTHLICLCQGRNYFFGASLTLPWNTLGGIDLSGPRRHVPSTRVWSFPDGERRVFPAANPWLRCFVFDCWLPTTRAPLALGACRHRDCSTSSFLSTISSQVKNITSHVLSVRTIARCERSPPPIAATRIRYTAQAEDHYILKSYNCFI